MLMKDQISCLVFAVMKQKVLASISFPETTRKTDIFSSLKKEKKEKKVSISHFLLQEKYFYFHILTLPYQDFSPDFGRNVYTESTCKVIYVTVISGHKVEH